MSTNLEYEKIKVKEIRGRYVTNDDALTFLSGLDLFFKVENIGRSVLGKPIKSIELGSGPERILLWSQMHGNESTTTKSVFDLINYLSKGSDILKLYTLRIIPILNPDGAEAYTRENANKVDLNRDAHDLVQPESLALKEAFDSFEPTFCFNLHDQRTIYNVGDTDRPATISFLSPSVDEVRTLTPSRAQAMRLIVAMNKMLQKIVPGQVGRYDDGYNINCAGDSFQTLGCPTVLFEAGHFQEDYQRETTRKLIFQALLTALEIIGNRRLSAYNSDEYFEIPENGKQFFDILIKNVNLYDSKYPMGKCIGLLYEETLQDGTIVFLPKIEKVDGLDSFFGHKTYDCAVEKDLLDLRANHSISSLINNI